MNCEDITSILDDDRFDLLSAEQLRQVEAHLAGCPACTSECEVHRAVLAAPIPKLPGSLEMRCRAVSGEYSGRTMRHAGTRPFIVGSLLVVGAAAAAVLSVEFLPDEEPDTVPPVSVAAPGATEATAANSFTADVPPTGTESGDTVAGDPPEDASAVVPATDSGQYTVGYTPLRQTATDPEAVQRSEAIYRAFIDALGAMPHLQLVEIERDPDEMQDQPEVSRRPVSRTVSVPALTEGTTSVTGSEQRTLTLLDSRTLREVAPDPGLDNGNNFGAEQELRFIPNALIGRVESITGEASGVSPVTGNGESINVDAMAGVVNVILDNNVENIRVDLNYMTESGSIDESLSHDFELDVSAGQDRDQGRFSVDARSRKGTRLSTGTDFSLSDIDYLDDALQRLIESLQQRLFPPEAERIEATRLRVMDPALSTMERLQTFEELKRIDNQWNNGAVQDHVLHSIIGMATATADISERVWIWQSLQGVDNPTVVAPLMNTLLNDPVEAVRLASAKALAGHADDVSARSALALAAETDASPEVRMNARWASLDSAGRRDYVFGTLLDARLSDGERLAPLLFQPDWNDGGIGDLSPAIDADVTRELTALLRRTDSIDDRATVLSRLYPVVSPTLVPLYLDRLRDDPSERVRGDAMNALRAQLDEPDVRFALEQAATGDQSEQIRNLATTILSSQNQD